MYKDLNKDAHKIATKKYGQNFLKDKTVLNKIIKAMPKDNLPIVEIGPGLGDLTRQLIEVGRVKAYEVDKRLCEYLLNEFEEPIKQGRLELICKDILKVKDSLHQEPYKLVANLPYYIATNIILNALKDKNCKDILVMVQKEVALKFCAKQKDRNFGSLAILAQSVANVNMLFEVAPQAFVPPPKVTSAVLHLQKRASLNDEKFEDFLKIATKQPRKTLIKNLSASYDKEILISFFEKLKLSLTARPHEISLSDYHQLYNLIKDRADESRRTKKSRKYSNAK